jgi:hypothetical protein
LFRLGGYCSQEHRQVLLDRHRALLGELLGEDPLAMPEVLDTRAFDRFALKVATHVLARMDEDLPRRYEREAPWLLDPLELALELKERLLRQLPASHVALEEARGWARLFRGGTYAFLQPLPADLLRQALLRAGIAVEDG